MVLFPKYSRRVLVRGVDERLRDIIPQVAQEHAAEVIEMEVMPDHVHLLIKVDPQIGEVAQRPFFASDSGSLEGKSHPQG